jgi:signal transduction histidine kinase
MSDSIRVLIVEDSDDDMILVLRALRRGGYEVEYMHVQTPAEMQDALAQASWDIIISDYTMPAFNALDALQILQSQQLDIPFLIVSGTIGEETAVAAMRAGAQDYLLKGKLARLVPAVERELKEAAERQHRHRAEKALAMVEAQLLRTQRLESLGTLASGIAHDLNNVLTPIIGIVQLLPLKIPNLDEKTKRLLQILDESTHRGASLVQQILSFTRGVESNLINTQVSPLLWEVHNVIQQAFPKEIDLVIDLPQDLWPIAADGTLLHQVFMNLCVNARDAMPDGGTLRITAENLEIDEDYAQLYLGGQTGSYVLVTIADTGTGIPVAILDRIFDPFFTTKEIGKGTGLGLATVQGIVKSHKGFINVSTEVGQGTHFQVYFPATTELKKATIVNTEAPLGRGEFILVVDDELAVQEVTKVMLEEHRYQVITANNGVEAIDLYREHQHKISVVLLDMMMPALDSITTIRRLRELNTLVPIVAMSGLATPEAVAETKREGVQAFLAKPFTAQELLNSLFQLCSK